MNRPGRVTSWMRSTAINCGGVDGGFGQAVRDYIQSLEQQLESAHRIDLGEVEVRGVRVQSEEGVHVFAPALERRISSIVVSAAPGKYRLLLEPLETGGDDG